MRNRLAVVAALLAALALLLELRELAGPGTERAVAPLAPPPSDRGLLDDRVAALEAAVEELRRMPATALVVPTREEAAEPETEPASVELARRVEVLERAVRALEGSGDEAERVARATAQGELVRLLGGRLSFEDALRRAQDPAATEAQQLEALRSLRGQRDRDNVDARLYVLEDVLELARTSRDGETRADVWRQLSGLTDPRLRQPLLDTLAFDEHAKAREEAAETLADFLPDRGVEAALRAARDDDLDAGVRRQAAESLAEGR